MYSSSLGGKKMENSKLILWNLIQWLMLSPRKTVLGDAHMECYIKNMQILICLIRRHQPPTHGEHVAHSVSKLPLWGKETHQIILMQVTFSVYPLEGIGHKVPSMSWGFPAGSEVSRRQNREGGKDGGRKGH